MNERKNSILQKAREIYERPNLITVERKAVAAGINRATMIPDDDEFWVHHTPLNHPLLTLENAFQNWKPTGTRIAADESACKKEYGLSIREISEILHKLDSQIAEEASR